MEYHVKTNNILDYGYGGGGADFSTTTYGSKGGANGGGFMAGGSQGDSGDRKVLQSPEIICTQTSY